MGPLVATFIRAPVTSRIELSVHASGTKSYDYSISKEFVTQAQRLTRLTSALSSIGRSPRGARLPLIVDNRCCCCIGTDSRVSEMRHMVICVLIYERSALVSLFDQDSLTPQQVALLLRSCC
jgi:hypothetical protein